METNKIVKLVKSEIIVDGIREKKYFRVFDLAKHKVALIEQKHKLNSLYGKGEVL